MKALLFVYFVSFFFMMVYSTVMIYRNGHNKRLRQVIAFIIAVTPFANTAGMLMAIMLMFTHHYALYQDKKDFQ